MDKTVLKIGAVPYADGTTQTLSLPRGRIYRELWIWLQGAPTVTAGNNVAANLGKLEVWELIKDIQIIVNGSNTIRRFTGRQLAMLNYFWTGGVAPIRETTYGDGATANPAFSRVLRIPFWMPYTKNPNMTLLDARRLVSLDLRVTFGTWTDINSAATAWTTTPTLTAYHEYVLPSDPKQQLGPYATWQQLWSQVGYSAAVNNNQIKLDLGTQFRGFMLNTDVSGTDTAALLSVFRWKSGAESFVEIDEEVLRESFWYQRGIVNTPSAVISKSSKFLLPAWYYYDRMDSGDYADALDTYGFVDNNLYVDIAGACTLNYMQDEIIPVRSASGGTQSSATGA